MYQAEAAHHLRREVPFFAAKSGAAGEGNPLRAVDYVTRRVLGHKGGVAGLLDALRQLGEHVVPGDLLPFVGTRRAVQRVFDSAGAGGQLHRGGALGTQSPFVDRAVRVALDLQQFPTAFAVVGRESHQGAANGAIGADGMGLRRAGDVETLLDLRRLRQIESEGGKPRSAGPGGADFQKVAARDLWHPIPQTERLWQAATPQPTDRPRLCQPDLSLPRARGRAGCGRDTVASR